MAKVKLKPAISFEVISESGESLGVFTQDSSWKEMVCLKNSRGESLIVDYPTAWIDQLFQSFGGSTSKELFVIKASPNLFPQQDPDSKETSDGG